MIHRIPALAALALLSACAANPPPPAQPSMALYPAPLASGATNRPGVAATDTGSMQQYVAPAGTGVRQPGSTGRDTGSMAIPEDSMGNLRRPAATP